MNPNGGEGPARTPLASLRRLMKPRSSGERCELCSIELPDEHPHLVELAQRRLCCACDACALLFTDKNAGAYRRVPRRTQLLTGFRLTDAGWDSLQLPINLAFFLHDTSAGRVVMLYPSPAGATEALPPEAAWQALVEDNPVLAQLEPDVEALLVNRLATTRDYYRVGIDECYRLVGLIRTHWRGLSGGTAVWQEIERFFAGLKQRSSPTGARGHA